MSGKHIIVLDDSAMIIEIITIFLQNFCERNNVMFHTTSTSMEALGKIQATTGQIALITDFELKGEDSLDLIQTTKEKWPETFVILMTGYFNNKNSRLKKAQQLIDNTIKKPFKSSAIQYLMQQYFQCSQGVFSNKKEIPQKIFPMSGRMT